MDNPRVVVAVDLLKQCKKEGKSYYDATQFLEQQGFTQSEVEQASYQFTYSDPLSTAMPDPSALQDVPLDNQAARDIAIQDAKEQRNKDSRLQFIPIIGGLYRFKNAKDISNYETLKTGYSQTTVAIIWIGVIAFLILWFILVPTWTADVSFVRNNRLVAILLQYAGIPLALLLFKILYRKRKN